MKRRPLTAADHCPCGHPLPYTDCCGRLHTGTAASTAEALMRSRYSAYVLGLEDYLYATWHPDTRPNPPLLDENASPKWIGLEVISFTVTGEDSATVEFVARCRIGGRAQRLRETSRFVRIAGRWLYVEGEPSG